MNPRRQNSIAKTKGWLWFEHLGRGIMPQRLVVSVNIFDPGNTSGWVKDTEVYEFFFKKCSLSRYYALAKYDVELAP